MNAHPAIVNQNRHIIAYWLPALLAGSVAAAAFMLLGNTPPVRATGLALVIVGMTLLLRPMGDFLALVGGLALAFSPAFWSQTGGTESVNPLLAFGVVAVAGVIVLFATRLSGRWFLGLTLGLLVFVLLFWSQLATLRSLRLNTLATAWLLVLLVSAVRRTNPRPDETALPLENYHIYGILLLFGIGVVNDPLFTLTTPAVVVGLKMTQTPLPRWYWLALVVVVCWGVYGIVIEYVDSIWFLASPSFEDAGTLVVPRVLAGAWREGWRWVKLLGLVSAQFTLVGLLLGGVGLARMSRWYPTVGGVTMLAYGAYALFGLVYFGADGSVLLLPLLMIQLYWMTYAVYTLGHWLQRSLKTDGGLVSWLAPAVFALLPLLMLARIMA